MTILQEDIDFLQHYGTKGQKWGVRRDPKTRAADRAKKREDRAKKQEGKADKLDAKLKNRMAPDRRRAMMSKKTAHVKAAKDIRDGKMTDQRKKMLKGAAVVTAITAAAVTYSAVQSGESHRLVAKGKAFLGGGDVGTFNKKGSLTSDFSADEIMQNVVKQINPDSGWGTKMNCRRCTFAYELRRRGNDVKATKTSNASGQTVFGLLDATTPDKKPSIAGGRYAAGLKLQTYLNRAKAGKASSVDDKLSSIITEGNSLGKKAIGQGNQTGSDIFKALRTQPNGSRGELSVAWRGGGGHSMAYEMVRGKPVIFDTQTGQKFSSAAAFAKEYKATDLFGSSIGSAAFTRLDNLPLNSEFLTRWATNA